MLDVGSRVPCRALAAWGRHLRRSRPTGLAGARALTRRICFARRRVTVCPPSGSRQYIGAPQGSSRSSSIHYPLSTIHYPLSTIHYPLSTIHYPLSTIHYPLSTIHHPPSTIHHPPSTIHSNVSPDRLSSVWPRLASRFVEFRSGRRLWKRGRVGIHGISYVDSVR